MSFAQRVLENVRQWAERAFLLELETDFARARTFDGLFPRQRLAVLRQQPPENLRILARALPLGVWSDSPAAYEARKLLLWEERKALDSLLAASATLREDHWYASLRHIERGNVPEFRRQFRQGARACNAVIEQIANKWKTSVVSCEAGEWGLVREEPWGRITVSFDLLKYLDLTYSICLSDRNQHSQVFHHHYLGVLGIGSSEWANESAAQCPETLNNASEFVRWHVEQYEALVERALTTTRLPE